jgi:nitronate monooxygenase
VGIDLCALREPIVQAPMAGGPSTPALTAAVSEAGGLGFLAAGYRAPGALRDDIRAVRELTDAPFGVNVFGAPTTRVDPEALAAYAETLRSEAERFGVAVGEPRFDDDGWHDKLELAIAERVAVVSFTFGCPSRADVARLQAADIDVWVTITDLEEAREACRAGADALVVQGPEGGGHRGSFLNEADAEDVGLLVLLRLVARELVIDLVAAGGIGDGHGVAAVLCAGAAAAQLGTAFMLAPEAGTSNAHRAALAERAPTRITRAFSGRRARGIVNRFMQEHEATVPVGYPEIHHLTAPIRAAARAADDPSAINLWAGQAYTLTEPLPAGEIVRRLGAEARVTLRAVARRMEERGDA